MFEKFIDSEMPVSEEDLCSAVHTLSCDNIKAFKLIASKCTNFNVNRIRREALSYDKPAFVFYFIELEATSSEDLVKLLYEALNKKDSDLAKVLINSLPEKIFQNLELGELLKTTNIVTNMNLLGMLLKKGVSHGGSRTSPILAVSMNQTLSVEEEIEALCVLIKGGVDCMQLSKVSPKSTTPLHVATDLALKSGKSKEK